MWKYALAVVFAFAALSPVAGAADDQPSAAGGGSAPQTLSQGELEALVAPIALYPDALLAQVLMASTYPLEVVQAARWAKSNKSLKGDALENALVKQDWDASVKSLVATPTVLDMMNENLDWTQKLGDAVLAQQPDVMDAVQNLRAKAEDNGKLKTTKQQTVSVSNEASGKQIITIAPTSTETVYVPYYEPSVVYGSWSYPSYPPYYWPPAPGWVVGGAIASGIAWGAGWAIGNAIWDDIDWNHGNIKVDIDKNVNINRNVNRNNVNVGKWEHNSYHRRGVTYNNKTVQNKYVKNNINTGDRKLDYRGRGGDQVLNVDKRPGGDNRPGGNNRPGGDNRPGVDNRPGDRPNLGERPGKPGDKRPDLGKDRPKAEAFDLGDGGKARDYSKRGQASLGDRGAGDFQRPSGGGNKGHKGGGGSQFKGGGGGGGAQFKGGGGGGRQMGGGGGGGRSMGGGGHRGGGGGGRGGGGRHSDIRLKEDIVPLGRLSNGLELYRFRYRGHDHTPYVGVMAQEVRNVRPDAVLRGNDGYLLVDYDRLGVKFMTWKEWQARERRP